MSSIGQKERERRDALKAQIRRLHGGEAVETVRADIVKALASVPYDEVVAAEQELISEGLPTAEVQTLCDLHSAALSGAIDVSRARTAPAGHPAHTFGLENEAIGRVVAELRDQAKVLALEPAAGPAAAAVGQLRAKLNELMDVDKHYRRKEYLVFPCLEKRGITGPPTVMWGKHDEIRAALKGAAEILDAAKAGTVDELRAALDLGVEPALASVIDMIGKEAQILLPMCLDTLTDAEWYEVQRQSVEYGYCLIEPDESWRPAASAEGVPVAEAAPGGRINLPSGSLSVEQLLAILDLLPIDITFVDDQDAVRYFSQGAERIFPRSRAILGRKVQFCHPPGSVHIVERILSDFRDGSHDRSAFWLQLHGKFIHIEYFAVRAPDGRYLGCLEVSQDLTAKRALEGDRRLLTYSDREE